MKQILFAVGLAALPAVAVAQPVAVTLSEFKIAMAAYGDYGPGYIGTAVAYQEGGYETQPSSSFVAPQVEEVLMGGIRRLLEK